MDKLLAIVLFRHERITLGKSMAFLSSTSTATRRK